MKNYTDPSAAGYPLEADACKKVLKDLQRSADKYKRKVEKERAARRREFETVMGYLSEEECVWLGVHHRSTVRPLHRHLPQW